MLEQTIKIITAAGELINDLKQNRKLKVNVKNDKSLVTNADKASEDFITAELKSTFGKDQCIVSEEAVADGKIPIIKEGEPFWLIDPIDATQSYVDGLGDYCINITYLENRKPTLGLIYSPITHTVWYAIKGKGSFKKVKNQKAESISVREIPPVATTITSKKGHQLTSELVDKYNIKNELVVASAIKFCYIAEGKADYYFRQRNKACDWDIASGDLIVTEAGGEVIILDCPNYTYGVSPFLAPSLMVKGKSKH